MFDLSWGEIALIGVVALVVIGPKELPGVLRGLGQALAKMRRMASDFQYQFNQALQEAEVDKVKSSINSVTEAVNTTPTSTFNPIDYAREQIKSTVDELKGQPAPGTIGPTMPDPLAQAIPAPPSYTADPAAIQAAFKPADPPAAFASPAPASAAPPAASPVIGAAPVDPPSGFMAMPAPAAPAEAVATPPAPPASEPGAKKTDA
ncbi:Sec-independent protein translocase protein TatB [Phreatobacter oligotrophus]|uniref:Sec-independent protein translocase protein TatB n=1 Tax=Phreatobacter oligotrophus TaxID=1122261 RepID=A0A2T4Z5L8_9HYPH|nr:Sec-independent protein translocase protein TatB [Phreatobacter oligotrophus]PTM57162.1 sec-independent protein translocase protein TatB [Phreatobacter oligotrophus]